MRSWPWLLHEMICAQSHYYIGIQIYATEPIVIRHLWKWFYWRHFESRFRENYLPDVVGGIIFTDPYFQQLASTYGREHLNMVKSGYGLNIDHWSQFYFMAPSLLLALPSHLDPGQKREKMWWRTENCRKNGGKIFSITFLLLMWLVCNGGEA